jgi:hypothetical protein
MAIPYLTSTTLPYGSRVVTIGAVGYIANNYSVSQSLNVIERQDSLGAPNGAIGIQQAKTGSAQVQLATSSTTAPAAGDTFSADSVTYFLTEISKPEEAQGFKVVDISFRESV